jgi:MFS transporter, putative metabolite transport protein
MTGVATPLIAREFDMTTAQHGVVGAASLFGILVGTIGLGGLADYFGRKTMFIAEMAIFILFLILLTMSPSYFWLVIFLFGVGVALGCDYPTAHLMISESIPSAIRGRLVLGAFGFQALGALTGTVVGYAVLKNVPSSARGVGCMRRRLFRPCSSSPADCRLRRARIGWSPAADRARPRIRPSAC